MKNSILPRTRNKLLSVFAVMFCLGLLHNGATFAKEAGPCAEDTAKFCKDVKTGGGRVAKCLKENEKQLSASCKNSIDAKKQKRDELSEVCKNDVSQFCKDTKPGGGHILKCLKEHEDKLSPECKKKMPSKK